MSWSDPSYLILDCETSSLFRYDLPADAEGQPRLAQIGMIFVRPDLTIEAEHEFLIKPDGWEMSEEAAAITGLTTERLLADGVDIRPALDLYAAGLDAGRVVVGHNCSFDAKMLRAELRRSGMDDRYIRTRTICTMQAFYGKKSPVKIPKANGKGGAPMLTDCCSFFGIDLPKAHSALDDARGAHGLLLKLRELNSLPAPKSPVDKHKRDA